MAIKNVPIISGPTYGGVIYGLNLSVGYSSEASKLTIDIVNKDGVYSTPKLNSSETVTFGNFSFNGIVWSHTIKESAGEKTLQVVLIDNSVLLDRFYVMLWKRGLLGQSGSPITKQKTFDFSQERILVPQRNTNLQGFPYSEFKEKALGKITEVSKSFKLTGGRKVGNVILVGTEKFANSACDIPDSNYTFNDLRAQIPVSMSSAPNNSVWKATHEGTLRETLGSWCSDLGFDFYWDFSSNTLRFFDVSVGIGTVPDVTGSNIVSKETSSSMEGTFRQYGVGYTSMPKSAVKTLNFTKSNVILYTISPYPLSYFINKIGAPQSITYDKGRWGGKRSQSNFVEAALLGFVCRSLRDLYSFQSEHWEALGYTFGSDKGVDKPQILSALKKFGFQDMISDLESFDAKDLPNYNFNFISVDQTLADNWNDIEQKLLLYHGKFYRASDSSGSFFYCNSNFTVEIEISVDPEGQVQEEQSENFKGRRIIDRGGTMSHDTDSAKEALGYAKLTNEIQNCSPIHINLKESGISDALVTAGLLSGADSKKVNTLLIYPSSERFVKAKLGFTSSLSRGLNPMESTAQDQKDANINSGKRNCSNYEKNFEKGSCKSFEEIARDKAIKEAGGGSSQDPDDFVSGLVSKTSVFCSITLKGGGRVKLCAPSDGALQVICRYNITVNKISKEGTQQFLFSSGSPGLANDVAEIRINSENITDPNEDSYQTSRINTNLIKPADASCVTPQKVIKYVFAGEPKGVNLNPQVGLSNLDVSLTSDGFTTTATFSSKPAKLSKADNTLRYVQSQLNRASFNAS